MKLLLPPAHDKTRHHLPPEALREFNTPKVTAFDPERFPILAKHWPGPMIVGDQLVCNDTHHSPAGSRRCWTAPIPGATSVMLPTGCSSTSPPA